MSLLLFAVGNTAWADDPFYSMTTSTGGTNNSYTGNCDVEINGITWNITGNSQMNPWRVGGKSLSGVDRTVYTKTAMGSAISKVELVVGTASGITVNSLKLTVASDANFSSLIEEVTATFAASSTISFEPTSVSSWDKNAYYKFTFNVTVSGNSNKFLQFSGVNFYAAESTDPTDTRTATTTTFPQSAYTFILGETFTSPVATLDPAAAGSVTYESSDDAVAEVDATNGELTLVAAGTATITATFTETEDYKGSQASYTLTVKEPAAVVTSLQALQEMATSTAQDVTLQLENIYVTAVKNAQAYITDGNYGALIYTNGHGLTAGQKFSGTLNVQTVLYRGQTEITGFSTTGLTITEEALTPQVKTIDQIAAANQSLLVTLENVTYDGSVLSDGTNSITPYTTFMSSLGLESGKTYNITGVVILYNTTLEIAPRDENDIVEVGGTALADPEIAYETSTYTITVGDDFTTPTLTNPYGLTVTYTGNNDDLASVDATTGELTFVSEATGSITVTATFAGDETYEAGTASYTLTVNAASVTPSGDDDEITYDFVGVTSTSYTEWSDKTGTSGVVYAGKTAGGTSTNHCVQMRSSGSDCGIVTTTSAGNVTKVTVEWNSATPSDRTLNIYGKNTAYSAASNLYDSSEQGELLGTIVCGTSTELEISGEYAYIGIRSSNNALYCDKITISWSTEPDERTATTVTLNPATTAYNVTLGDDFTAPTANVNDGTNVLIATLTYESSDPTVATVDAAGAVAILAAGTTTITAKFEGTTDYKPSKASYTLTVTAPASTIAAPVFSPAGGTYTEEQTVTITCATDGATILFSSKEDPRYSGFVYSEPLTISETETINAVAYYNGEYSEIVTAEYIINIIPAIPTGKGINSNYFVKVTDLSQIEDGDAVLIVNEENNKALSTTQQANNRKGTDFTWIPWTDGNIADYSEGLGYIEKFILVNAGSDYYYFYANGGVKDGYIYMAGASSNNYLKTQDNIDSNAKTSLNINAGNATIKFHGTGTKNWLRFNNSANLFSCYASGQQDVQLYVEVSKPEYKAVTIPQAATDGNGHYYKTLVAPYDMTTTGSNVKAYIVTVNAEQTEATFVEVTNIPAGTPVIVEASDYDTSYNLLKADDSATMNDVTANMLQVSKGNVTGDGKTILVLNKVDELGFYALREGTTLASGKCYIQLSGSSVKGFIGFHVEESTGIETVGVNTVDSAIYNLQGQRVTMPTRGIYVVNGKKVFIK